MSTVPLKWKSLNYIFFVCGLIHSHQGKLIPTDKTCIQGLSDTHNSRTLARTMAKFLCQATAYHFLEEKIHKEINN